jgi:hypothetical protein
MLLTAIHKRHTTSTLPQPTLSVTLLPSASHFPMHRSPHSQNATRHPNTAAIFRTHSAAQFPASEVHTPAHRVSRSLQPFDMHASDLRPAADVRQRPHLAADMPLCVAQLRPAQTRGARRHFARHINDIIICDSSLLLLCVHIDLLLSRVTRMLVTVTRIFVIAFIRCRS